MSTKSHTSTRRGWRAGLAALVAAASVLLLGLGASSASAAPVTINDGTLSITNGRAAPDDTSPPAGGSWVRLRRDGTSNYYRNSSSTAVNPTYTLLNNRNGLFLGGPTQASGIFNPTTFDTIPFDGFTTSTGTTLTFDDSTNLLTGGDLTAFNIRWNTLPFDVGSRVGSVTSKYPVPVFGSYTGDLTRAGRNTVTLEWVTDIDDFPFEDYEAVFHWDATYTPNP